MVQPGQALIRRILQRGVDRGEFTVADMDTHLAVYSVIAAMVFLVMSKHSLGACVPADRRAGARRRYIEPHKSGIILNGVCSCFGGKK